MSEKIVITGEQVETIYESKFIKVYDLQYAEGKHYLDATRREKDNIVAIKNDEEFKKMNPDAVTCVVIMDKADTEPTLLMAYEYRYPAGQFLLSPPAGLIDAEDAAKEDAIILTAIREIKEETGIDISDGDRVEVISPLLFSSPGMTDESNALVLAVINEVDTESLSQEGAVGSEKFDGFRLINKEEAILILKNGKDDDGIFFSVYTWAALMYFVSDMWKIHKDYRKYSAEPDIPDCGCIYG